MNGREGRGEAAERLLDAALEQVFAGEAVAARPLAKSPPRRTWLAAAVVLFALAITTALMWQARGPGRALAQQPTGPAPLPAQQRAASKAEIDALPADTANLCALMTGPEELEQVTRLHALRRLQIAPSNLATAVLRLFGDKGRDEDRKTGKAATWNDAPADFLSPLASLPELEALDLSGDLVSSRNLPALKACPKLRSLSLDRGFAVDDALVTALTELPHLRALRFDIVHLDAAAVTRLRRLALEEIELSRCPGFDATAFAELCAMKSLREVSFAWLGRPDFFTGDRKSMLWMPGADDLRRLEALPALRSLTFARCAIAAEHLAALPTGITSLALSGTDLAPDDFRLLKRFGKLRHLDLATAKFSLGISLGAAPDLAAKADAFAAAVGSLRLTSLDYAGALTEDLMLQIAQQPDLTSAHLRTHQLPSLAALAGAPRLRDLAIVETNGPSHLTVEDLAPLARCRALRRFDLRTYDADVTRDELAKLFGPTVEVTVSTSEILPKK
ncbi:MAG: hypothetical protein U1E73_04955 [Planctomycetota bacterium]